MSEKEFNEIFSSNLVRYLESRNMSQNELAKYLGVSPTSVNNWCRGLKSPRPVHYAICAGSRSIEA